MATIQTPSLTGSPIPMPGIYREQQAMAQKAYQTSLASINQRRQAMLRQYGMTANVDPQGVYSNYRVDPNSQYGNLQTMKQTQGMAINQSWDQAADRGLGNSGLAAQGESLLRYGQGAESAQLGDEFVQGMGDLAQTQTGAQDTLAQRMYQAEADARQEAIQNEWFTQVPYGDSATGGGAGGGNSDMADFMYGNYGAAGLQGYSDEALFAAAQAAAPEGGSAVPMHIMHNGEVTYQNGVPGIYIKYQQSDGHNTIWIPLPTKQQPTPQPTPIEAKTMTTPTAQTTAPAAPSIATTKAALASRLYQQGKVR